MDFLLGIFLFFGGIYLTFRLFGKQILQFGLKQVLKRLVKDVDKQSQAYQRNYGEDAFHEQVYMDQEIKVSAPKHSQKKEITADDIAEDVDFEEIR